MSGSPVSDCPDKAIETSDSQLSGDSGNLDARASQDNGASPMETEEEFGPSPEEDRSLGNDVGIGSEDSHEPGDDAIDPESGSEEDADEGDSDGEGGAFITDGRQLQALMRRNPRLVYALRNLIQQQGVSQVPSFVRELYPTLFPDLDRVPEEWEEVVLPFKDQERVDNLVLSGFPKGDSASAPNCMTASKLCRQGGVPSSSAFTNSLVCDRELGLYGGRRYSKLPVGWTSQQKQSVARSFIPSRPHDFLNVDSNLYGGQFSKDGRVFVAACQGSQLLLMDVFNGFDPFRAIEARDIRWTVTDTAVSPNGEMLLYSSITPEIHLCNIYGEYERHDSIDLAEDGAMFGVWSIKWNHDGTEVIAGSNSHHLIVHDMVRDTNVVNLEAHGSDINAVCFAEEDFRPNVFLTGSDDHTIRIWDRRMLDGSRGSPVGVLLGHVDGITHLSSKGDGFHILSNSKDQSAKLWDIRHCHAGNDDISHDELGTASQWDYRWSEYPHGNTRYRRKDDDSVVTYTGHTVRRTLIRCYFSPAATTGQRFVYTGSGDGTVVIYDTLTGQKVKELKHCSEPVPVRDVSWHPTLPLLTSVGFDEVARVWVPAGGMSPSSRKWIEGRDFPPSQGMY